MTRVHCIRCEGTFRHGSRCACGCEHFSYLPRAAVDSLCEQYLGLPAHVAWKFAQRYPQTFIAKLGGVDELRAEGDVALVNAARLYQPSRGVKFMTYAYAAIYRQLLKFVMLGTVQKRQLWLTGERLDDEHDLAADGMDPADAALERIEIERVHDALEGLPDQWQRILKGRYFRQLRLKDVARTEKVSKERIRQIQAAALKILAVRLK